MYVDTEGMMDIKIQVQMRFRCGWMWYVCRVCVDGYCSDGFKSKVEGVGSFEG